MSAFKVPIQLALHTDRQDLARHTPWWVLMTGIILVNICWQHMILLPGYKTIQNFILQSHSMKFMGRKCMTYWMRGRKWSVLKMDMVKSIYVASFTLKSIMFRKSCKSLEMALSCVLKVWLEQTIAAQGRTRYYNLNCWGWPIKLSILEWASST